MPTEDQIKSREEMAKFLTKMKSATKKIGSVVRSQWFDRPDEELQGWIERGRLLAEVKDSRWIQLQIHTIEQEINWAQQQLEVCKPDDLEELRLYLRSLRFVKGYILTTERNADVSSSVLAGRPSAIAKGTLTFTRNATPDQVPQSEERDAHSTWSS